MLGSAFIKGMRFPNDNTIDNKIKSVHVNLGYPCSNVFTKTKCILRSKFPCTCLGNLSDDMSVIKQLSVCIVCSLCDVFMM